MAEDYSMALRRSEEDLRYPLGTAQPIQSIAQEFANSPNHIKKVEDLRAAGFSHVRRVRGDGNCFYRAVGFAWLEALALRSQSQPRAAAQVDPALWPRSACFGALATEYRQLRDAVHQGGAQTPLAAERLLTDVRFDLCVIVLVRRIVADYMNRSLDAYATTMRDMVVAQYHSVENFVSSEVLPLGREAEGVSIPIVARELGVEMRILQLDGRPGRCPDIRYPSEDYRSPCGISICLLFRPGHYELLYHRSAPRLPDPLSMPGECSFCHERVHLVTADLLPCFHRLCRGCTAQARPGSSTSTQCPICAEVLPEHALREAWPPATAPVVGARPSERQPQRADPKPHERSPLPRSDAYLLAPATMQQMSPYPMQPATMRHMATPSARSGEPLWEQSNGAEGRASLTRALEVRQSLTRPADGRRGVPATSPVASFQPRLGPPLPAKVCSSCRGAQQLRRVQCCAKYFCVGCLQQMLESSWALQCRSCGAAWDPQQLARACGMERRALPMPAQTAPMPAQTAPMPGRRCALCQREFAKLVPARCCGQLVCEGCDRLGGRPLCVCVRDPLKS